MFRQGGSDYACVLIMRLLGQLRPEPGPSARETWSLAISLTMLAAGLVLALINFHQAGVVGDELCFAAIIFVVAVPAGSIVAVMQERRAYARAQETADRE